MTAPLMVPVYTVVSSITPFAFRLAASLGETDLFLNDTHITYTLANLGSQEYPTSGVITSSSPYLLLSHKTRGKNVYK